MTPLARALLAVVIVLVAGCSSSGPATSARSGCYEQTSAGSQGYDIRTMFFLFCRQSS